MQQDNCRCVLGPCFAIEDFRAINLNCPIADRRDRQEASWLIGSTWRISARAVARVSVCSAMKLYSFAIIQFA